jgi:nucleoside-diphosphate-sugar epimerase
MPVEVIGSGMLAHAFVSAAETGPDAIICAAGVADSQTSDVFAFRRERSLLNDLAHRARAQGSILVCFSGAPIYGRETGIRVETAQATPETPYGRHKLECERLVTESGARYLVLRLPNVVGPGGHPHQLIPSLVAQVLSGSVVTKTGATRDLLDVDDLVRIVAALLRRGVCNSILNVASGVSTPISRLVEVIAETLGTSPSVLSTAGGGSQEFSIAEVRGLLPKYPRFGPDYPINVLVRRVPVIARTLTEQPPQ